MTTAQADHIRKRFHETEGWDIFQQNEVRFAKALEALPDETLMRTVNTFCREMFEDAKKQAELTCL
jgi:hypothetical protein